MMNKRDKPNGSMAYLRKILIQFGTHEINRLIQIEEGFHGDAGKRIVRNLALSQN